VFYSELRDASVNMINLKNIQISKEASISDLKIKLKRCIKSYLANVDTTNCQVKIYLKSLWRRDKKEIFESIFSYINKEKSFRINADEILDDNLLIEVSMSIIK
jgi:hypothetical protein